jgi:hypothetical protein
MEVAKGEKGYLVVREKKQSGGVVGGGRKEK